MYPPGRGGGEFHKVLRRGSFRKEREGLRSGEGSLTMKEREGGTDLFRSERRRKERRQPGSQSLARDQSAGNKTCPRYSEGGGSSIQEETNFSVKREGGRDIHSEEPVVVPGPRGNQYTPCSDSIGRVKEKD